MRIEKTFAHQFGKVIERYHAFSREHNALQKDEKYRDTRATMLREPHLSKVKAISSLYLKKFWNMMNSPIWADSDIVPMLEVSRWDLANLCNCSRRTVQDHLARLSAYGIIEIEDSYATVYRIKLNIWLLLGIDEFKPKTQKWAERATKITKVSPNNWQSLPHLNNQENLNNKYKAEDVENLPHERHQEISQEKQEIANPAPTNQEKNQKNNGGAAADEAPTNYSSAERFEAYRKGNLNRLRYPKAQKIEPKGILDVEKGIIVQNFWKFAKELFYPNRRFVAKIDAEIQQVIRKDVFMDFEGEHDFTFWQIYNMRMQFWAEKKQAWDAKLDREAYFPIQYFSKEYGNSKKQGFLVVKVWEKKAEKSLKEIEFEKELEKAKLAMIQYPITGAVPKGQKGKIENIIQLSQYWYRKLSVRTNSEFVGKFAEFLANSKF